jgi:hypothetical protein
VTLHDEETRLPLSLVIFDGANDNEHHQGGQNQNRQQDCENNK